MSGILRREGEGGIVGEAGGNEAPAFMDDGDGERDGGSGNMYACTSAGTSTSDDVLSFDSDEGGGRLAGSDVGTGGRASTGGGETGSTFAGPCAAAVRVDRSATKDSDTGETPPPNLKEFIRSRSTLWFLDTHSFLMRSAAEGFASSGCFSGSSKDETTGMNWSCSISCVLRSLLGSGGRRPRSRKAASRWSFRKTFETAGGGGIIWREGEVEVERGLNFVVSMRIMVRDLERGRWSVACLVMA